MEWASDSSQKDAYFILNSQDESQFSQEGGTQEKRLDKQTPSSQQKCKSGRRQNITEQHPFSPRNVFSPSKSATRGHCVKALVASNGNGEPASQSVNERQQAPGGHHNDNGNHGDSGHGDAPGAAAGGGGGDDGGGGGGGGDHHDDDPDDDGGPHEETPPISSSSSGNSVPLLVRPSGGSSQTHSYPQHPLPHLENPEMLGESQEVAGTSGVGAAYVAESDSDEEGGALEAAVPLEGSVLETSEAESVVSEATTAVVSDTDRYAQVVGERSGTSHPSPVRSVSSVASQEARAVELSSAVSTLSSLTSSSSGSEQPPSFRPPKRRLPARRGRPKIIRSRLDTSSTSTSTTDSTTTSVTTTTTTSDTSPERTRHQSDDQAHDSSPEKPPGPSGDPSRDTAPGGHDVSHDKDGRSHDDKDGQSQQDMFADDTPVIDVIWGTTGSFQPMVMDTLEEDDDDGPLSCVSPSQEAYESSVSIIPASPKKEEEACVFHSLLQESQRTEDGNDIQQKGRESQPGGLVDYSGSSSQDLVLHFTQTQASHSSHFVAPSSHPMTQRSQPMTQGSQPMTHGSQPMTQRSQPMTKGSQPITQGSQPITQGSQPMTQGSQPMTQGSQPMTQGSQPMTQDSQSKTVASNYKDSQQPIKSQSVQSKRPSKAASQYDRPIKMNISKGGRVLSASQPVAGPQSQVRLPLPITGQHCQNEAVVHHPSQSGVATHPRYSSGDHMTSGSSDSQSQGHISGFHLSIPKGGSQTNRLSSDLEDSKPCDLGNVPAERDMKHSDNTSTQDSVKYSMELKLNVDPAVSPSLVLDLNNTDTQQTSSQHSFTPTFHIDRPSLDVQDKPSGHSLDVQGQDKAEEEMVSPSFNCDQEEKVPDSLQSSCDSRIEDPFMQRQSGKPHPTLLKGSSQGADITRNTISVTQTNDRTDLDGIHGEQQYSDVSQQATECIGESEKEAAGSDGKLQGTSEGYDSMTQVYNFTNLRQRQEDDHATTTNVEIVDTPKDTEHLDVIVPTQREPPVACEPRTPSGEATHADVPRMPQTSSPKETSSRLTERSDVRVNPNHQAVAAHCGTVDKSPGDRTRRTTTIKTVLCRTIVILEERVGGMTVTSSVMDENLQTLSQQITHSEELFETPSPSRTGQSMTSGDLGDISSISTTPSIPDRRSCLSSRLSKGRSKSSSSSSLSRISPVETVLPPDGGGKRSDVLQRSSTSSFASVAFSDLMSSSTNVLLGRRSSVLGAATTNTTTNKKSIDMPVSRAVRPVVVETTHNITNVHPADMDTMIYTNQWDMIGRGATAAIGQNVAYPRRSSSSFAPSDLLFPDDDEKRLSKDSRHSRSTSGGSTGTDHTMAGDAQPRSSGSDDHLFSRPGQPLSRRSSHVTGGSQSRHPQVESPDREKVTETVGLDEAEVEQEAEKKESPEVPKKDDLQPAQVDNVEPSPAPKSLDATIGKTIFEPGSAVLARWRDGRYYPGHVVCQGKRTGSYMVAFEDGDVAQTCHLITFDIIRVGDEIFAQTSDGWNAPAVIQGHYGDGEGQGYLVEFDTGDEARVPRCGIMLSRTQVETLVAAHAKGEPSAPPTGGISDTAPPLAGVASCDDQERQDGGHLSDEATTSCDYEPLCPQPLCGTLPEGAQVMAMWQDKHFYHGHVTSYHPDDAQYTVTFADRDVLRIAESDMFVCELLTAGQHVFADSVKGWNKPATVIGHYCNHDDGSHYNKHGYVVKLKQGGETISVPRSKVSMNSAQATELFKAFGKVRVAPQSCGKADVSLDNLMDGKRKKMRTPKVLSSARRRNAKTKAADEESEPRLTLTDVEHGNTETPTPMSARGVGKEQVVESATDEAVLCLRGIQEDTASTTKQGGGTTLRTVEKGGSKRKLGPNSTSTPTPKRGRPRKLDVEGSAKDAGSITKSLRLTSSKKKTRNATPRTGLRTGRRGKLELDHTTTTSTPAPEEEKEGQSESVHMMDGESTTRSLRATSSRKKIGDATPRTGLRMGRKGKLELADETTTGTPAPEEEKGCQSESGLDFDDGNGAFDISYASPKMNPPKKVKESRAALFPHTKGIVPPKGSGLFHGIAFLLTHADKTVKLPWQRVLPGDSGTTEESGAEEDVDVAYDKEHLITQIEAGGGVILDKFDLNLVRSATQCVLVSDTFQRTLKYLHCLAADVTCISHLWVRDSCNMGVVQEYKNYLLPAGVDVETNKVVERDLGMRPLEGLHLMVSSDNTCFKEVWMNVLDTAGCHFIHKFPIRSTQSGESSQLDLVVADRYISPSVVHRAVQLHVPLVSAEWIIQCLVSGRIRDSDAHPMYQHDYDDKTSVVTT